MPTGQNPDEIPIADAVEQDQETAPEPGPPARADPPLEADAPDWQEQLHEVVGVEGDDYPG
ncbi:hypothetical protein C1Y40_03130 [Mycobacterium talmoniae]|uniref:Uncharacterized protein n=1 Tax=Mycobacterium talmoniae TaxID=1858794 RepID=A0A2S8BJ88_9MYCO|nr:hypothetical protein [Mycobacterium eburneum]PQM46693.1 hypothetical protein C1Y40_03130 [Mycobacterium talmoniae]TDH49769.1 hypothetical protein E2F47_19710 [Mycobacterium eburneum]